MRFGRQFCYPGLFYLEHASTTPVSYLIYFFYGGRLCLCLPQDRSPNNVIALHMLNNIVAMAVLSTHDKYNLEGAGKSVFPSLLLYSKC